MDLGKIASDIGGAANKMIGDAKKGIDDAIAPKPPKADKPPSGPGPDHAKQGGDLLGGAEHKANAPAGGDPVRDGVSKLLKDTGLDKADLGGLNKMRDDFLGSGPKSDGPGKPADGPAPAAAPGAAPPPAANDRGRIAADNARKYEGVPYVYGGTTPSGFDCSGLTMTALKEAGVDVPRTSQAQFSGGTPVDRGDLKAGDLVFFEGDPPGHVGIYAGDGMVTHSPTTGDVVKTTPLDQTGTYSGARRYA